jgi:predicted enzyme related to lactoylglutathione lyase
VIPKPVLINFPADDVEQSVGFFEALLGIPMARSLSYDVSYHAPVSSDGILLTVNKRRFPGEVPTVFFAVDDLAAALDVVVAEGGTVVAGPFDLPLPRTMDPAFRAQFRESPFVRGEAGDSMGTAATVHDAQGNRFGLMELAEWAHATFRVGRYHNPVTPEQMVDHSIALRRDVSSLTEPARA